MRGVDVPDREDDFTADPVELFFDLVFVFAFSRLVYHLVHLPTWTGAFEFALLLLMIWLPWTQFTWSANAVSGNTRPVRVLFLVATVASVPMAGSVTAAFDGGGGPTFAISLSVILSMALFTMILGLEDGHEARASIIRYSVPNWVAMGVMIVGSFLPRDPRTVCWIVAVVIVVVGTVRAGSSEWLVRPGHFAERHGLIVIVALGEVIVALGLPVVDSTEQGSGLPGLTLAALVASGVFAGLLWWAFFDRPNPAMEHRHERIDDPILRGRYARNVYTYAHFPIVAGIVLSAAALEEITQHPGDQLATPFRWMLATGLVLNLLGIVLAIWLSFRVLAKERLIGAGIVVVVILLTGRLTGLEQLLVMDAVVFLMLVAEQVRIESPLPRSDAPHLEVTDEMSVHDLPPTT